MERETLKLHPIQAVHIAPKELRIKTHVPPNLSLEYEADFDLDVGHSDYYSEQKRIQIATRVQIGSEEPEIGEDGNVKGHPFYLNVELVGMFEVDDTVFPAERIYEWATTNAMFIMYPYLREHVFALTARAGFTPMLMPLVEVPLFKVEKAAEGEPLEPSITQPNSETTTSDDIISKS